MRRLSMVLAIAAAPCAYAAVADPPQVLYETAMRLERAGRLESAQTVFLTLATTYVESVLVARAKSEIGAILLFQQGRQQLQAKQQRSALITFRTIARVYPESPLARLANDAARPLMKPGDISGRDYP